MFIANLIKILLIFFFVYFVIQVIKSIIIINKNVDKKIKSKKRDENIRNTKSDNSKIIELDKDQYKVE